MAFTTKTYTLATAGADGSASAVVVRGCPYGRLVAVSVQYTTDAPAGTTLLITATGRSLSTAVKTLFGTITGNTDIALADVAANPHDASNTAVTTRNMVHPVVGGELTFTVGSANHDTVIDLSLLFEV